MAYNIGEKPGQAEADTVAPIAVGRSSSTTTQTDSSRAVIAAEGSGRRTYAASGSGGVPSVSDRAMAVRQAYCSRAESKDCPLAGNVIASPNSHGLRGVDAAGKVMSTTLLKMSGAGAWVRSCLQHS